MLNINSYTVSDISIEEVNEVIERIMDTYGNEDVNASKSKMAYVKIVEQPARCALRFRYECEGRSAGSIPGQSTTQDNKTYPTIQVVNYKGPAVVVVSCVTKDFPYRPHPHNLVGKEGCKKGVCTMVINNPEMLCSFTSLGIQCVKRKDIEESLKLREAIKVDPFRTGFAHKNQASNIDLNVVRLCFQVFIEGSEKDKFTVPLQPVVCEPIYDKKAMSDLIITKLSHCSAPVTGGKEVILLCDRVTKDDIQVRFYEEKNGQVVWEGMADMQPNDVHKQVAISFRTPRYYNESIQQPVVVYVQLRRPSDGQLSDARPFQFLPREIDPEGLGRKRQKIEEGCLDRYLRENTGTLLGASSSVAAAMENIAGIPPKEVIRVPRMSQKIKVEPSQLSHTLQSSPSPWATSLRSTSPNQNAHQPIQLMQPTLSQSQSQDMQSILKSNSIIVNQSVHNFSGAVNIKSEVTDVVEDMSDSHASTVSQLMQQAKATVNSVYSANRNPTVNNNRNNTLDVVNHASSTNNNNNNNNVVEGPLTEKLDSLDLDIDPSDLMNDINFNNMMIMMDSGNNITFNSSGNINMEPANASGSLSTPQILDISDSGKNILASATQMSRLQNDLMRLQNNIPPSSGDPQ